MPSEFDRTENSAAADDRAASTPPASASSVAKPAVSKPAAPKPSASTPAAGATAPVAPARRGSISRAAWTALVIGVVVLIFMLVFILQNNVPAQFTFLAWTFNLPLGVAVLFAAIAGALITAMVGTVRMIVLGRSVRSLQQERSGHA